MISVDEVLFGAIRIAVSGSLINFPNLSDRVWNDMYELSLKQSVTGLLIDAIEFLPENKRPNRELLLKFIGIRNIIAVRNDLLNQRAKQITDCFADSGFNSCILKGQSVARLYRNPMSRVSGDIDIWVSGDENEIISFVKKKFPGKFEKPSYMHIGIKPFDDVEIEVHYRLSYSSNPWLNLKLQRFFTNNSEEQFIHKSGLGFNSPTVRFDCVYSLSHIYRHFIHHGIGLRQIIDYYYILQNLPITDHSWVIDNLKKLKMARFLGAIEWILLSKLYLDKKYILCPLEPKFGQAVLNEVLLTGSFGRYDYRMNHTSHLYRYSAIVSRQIKFIKFCPSEFLWAPIYTIKSFLGAHVNNIFEKFFIHS